MDWMGYKLSSWSQSLPLPIGPPDLALFIDVAFVGS